MSTCVALATYRRPAGLRAVLRSVMAAEHPAGLTVVVADNDPDGGAADTVASLRPPPSVGLVYVHEPRSGIAAARNAALAAAGDARRIAFVDDDEVVAGDWLRRLHGTLDENPAACAVQGAVGYAFDVAPPAWVRHGGFFISVPEETVELPFAATNNLMIDRTRLPAGFRLEFDHAFGLTGGSDIALTRALTRAGGRILTCPRAVVTEHVPAARCRGRWSLRRAARTGNTLARVQVGVDGRSRLAVALGHLARVGGGLAALAPALIARDPARSGQALRRLARGLGGVAACLHLDVVEYARPGGVGCG